MSQEAIKRVDAYITVLEEVLPGEAWRDMTYEEQQAAIKEARGKEVDIMAGLVTLLRCYRHHVKNCVDHGKHGSGFASLPMADRNFWSWVIRTLAGIPAASARFRCVLWHA